MYSIANYRGGEAPTSPHPREPDALAQALHSLTAVTDAGALLDVLSTHFIVSITDRRGRIIEMNDAFCAISGYSRPELLGAAHRIVNSGAHPPDFFTQMWDIISAGHSWRGQICNKAKNGSLYWVDSIIAPLLDAQGEIDRFVSIRSDITAFRAHHEDLAARKQRLRRLYEATPAMLYSTDLDGRLTTMSDLWLRTLGYERDEAVGRALVDFMTPAFRLQMTTAILPAFHQSGVMNDVAAQMVRKDGKIIDVRLSGILERDADGRPWRSSAAIIDVTEKAEAERRLAESEARYRALVEDQSELVSLATPDGTLTFVNPAYARHCGQEAGRMIGTSLYDYVPAAEHAAVKNQLARMVEADGPVASENRVLAANGTAVWIAWINRALTDADGRVIAIHSVGRDITKRKQLYEALRASQSFLARTGAVAGVGGWEVDLLTGVITWSDETCRLHDMPAGHCPSMGEALGYYTPDARPIIEAAVRDGAERGIAWDLELPLVSATGRPFWARVSGSVEVKDGIVVRLVGAFQDITQRRAVARALADQHELLRVTLQSIGDAVITTDAEGIISWLNPAAARMTGWSSAEAEGRPLTQVFHIIDEASRAPAENPVAACLACGEVVGLADHTTLISRTGAEFGIADSAAPIRSSTGEILGVVLVFHDVTEQRRMSGEMTYRATHDALTGLVNRSEFEGRLARLLRLAQENQSQHALLFLDLDQFKLVNDSCGHAVGDQLLQQVAKILADAVRSRDTLARLGGDEFAILLEQCTAEQALVVAQKICDRMDHFRFTHDEKRFRVGASIGLVPVDERWPSIVAIQQAADSSCYAAKEAGRNRVHAWYDSDLKMRARLGEMQWTTRVERALDEDRFVLYAQGIHPLQGSAQGAAGGVHAEVLIRMLDDDGALVLPGAFLPAAERFHLASRIDRWVVSRTIAWLRARPCLEGLETLSVNLSGQSVGDRAFHRWAINSLAEAGPEICARVCLEVTETAAVNNIADAMLFIEQVRALGVRVSLDDFGAGASWFGYLKKMPVDYLKIDGQFVRNLATDSLDEAAIRCFVDVAKLVGMNTVAEFVEDQAVLDRLNQIGVDFAQGYFMDRPAPLDQLLDRPGLTGGPPSYADAGLAA